jgi:hypothetical protein
MSVQIKVLVDPAHVIALILHPTFIRMVAATRDMDMDAVKIYSSVLEKQGYTIDEIIAAVENVG